MSLAMQERCSSESLCCLPKGENKKFQQPLEVVAEVATRLVEGKGFLQQLFQLLQNSGRILNLLQKQLLNL